VETTAAEAPQNPTILVVDDERGPRLALELILRRDFRVLTADSGEQALEILRNEPVDAITLDLKMPGLAGQNTLSLIRGIDPDLPVIIITGYGSYESAVKALKLRAFDYVSKPFDSKKILSVIENAVDERRRARAHESVFAPLDAVIEAADWLEHSGADWLSNPDHAALDAIRSNVRSVQEQFRTREIETLSFDLFDPRKGHG
jgi:DNA-binding NtrC family response regulator